MLDTADDDARTTPKWKQLHPREARDLGHRVDLGRGDRDPPRRQDARRVRRTTWRANCAARLKRALDEIGREAAGAQLDRAERVSRAPRSVTARAAEDAPHGPERRVAEQPAGAEAAASGASRRTEPTSPCAWAPAASRVGGSFWDEVGGRPTFEKLVRAFYARRRRRPGAAADVPGGARPRGRDPAADRVPRAVLGRAGHLQRAARTPAAADAAPAVHGHPRRPRPLAAAHARRGRHARAVAAARGDALGLPRARRARDGQHLRRTVSGRAHRPLPRRTTRDALPTTKESFEGNRMPETKNPRPTPS